MASAFGHALAAVTVGNAFARPKMPFRFWILTIVSAILPDLDVLGLRLGIRYGDVFGHRGFTHSLLFAALLSGLVTICLLRVPRIKNSIAKKYLTKSTLFLCFFMITLSHGLLDALTNGGLGVAFFSPFSNERYFFPWHPIQVSPIRVTQFFTSRGLIVLESELLWIGVPCILFLMALSLFRGKSNRLT